MYMYTTHEHVQVNGVANISVLYCTCSCTIRVAVGVHLAVLGCPTRPNISLLFTIWPPCMSTVQCIHEHIMYTLVQVMSKKNEWISDVPQNTSQLISPTMFPPDKSLLAQLQLEKW